MKRVELLRELKQIQKNINNVGPALSLWTLLELLITYFKVEGGEKDE